MAESLSSLFTPAMPSLDDLFHEAQPCHCQPAKTPFVAIPAIGAHLVQNGLTAPVPEDPSVVPFDDVVSQTIRGMYEHAAHVLTDAPPGTLLELRLIADLPASRRTFVTQVFQRAHEEATHG